MSKTFGAGYQDLIDYFEDMEVVRGSYTIDKLHAGAEWGDNQDVNFRTGAPITLHDISQIFKINYSQSVPIDSLIAELESMSEVMWVDEPVVLYFGNEPNGINDQIVGPAALDLPTPNNPRWSEIETFPDFTYITDSLKQWATRRVGAPEAWDIAKGAGITIGIIDLWQEPSEQNYPGNALHPDVGYDPLIGANRLDNSAVGFKYGGHGLLVASVAGAITDNNESKASLGWRVRLKGFSFSPVLAGIRMAACLGDYDVPGCEPVDVINMSFISFSNVSAWREALQDALAKGVIPVAAAGNYHGPPTA